MTENMIPRKSSWAAFVARAAPGLTKLLSYQKSDLSHDLIAGLSVAAVALPVGVAYAQLAGFNPAVGPYSSILPLVAYAIFGTSRQLIIGPTPPLAHLLPQLWPRWPQAIRDFTSRYH